MNMLLGYMAPEDQRVVQLRVRQRRQRRRPRPNLAVNGPRGPLKFDGGAPGAPRRPQGGSRLGQNYTVLPDF